VCGLFNDGVGIHTTERREVGWYMNVELKGFGRKRSGPNIDTTEAIAWRNWIKHENINHDTQCSDRHSNQVLPNLRQESYRCSNMFSTHFISIREFIIRKAQRTKYEAFWKKTDIGKFILVLLEAYEWVEVLFRRVLIWALDSGQWTASCLSSFIPDEKFSGTHRMAKLWNSKEWFCDNKY
jgi:hypothetical protein